MAQSNQAEYAKMDKDALVTEIKTRRAAARSISVDLRANEDKLRAALDTDDMENGDFDPNAKPPAKDAQPPVKPDLTVLPAGATELTPEQLRRGAAARADGTVTREVPEDLHEYSGNYRYRVTGEEGFGLKVLKGADVRANKTHHAKSPLKFWDGTEEEFRQQFDKL